MPARRRAERTVDTSLCGRCQDVELCITVRTEGLCKACFRKYVQTKVVKRMESFRVRHSMPGKERKLLLALSLGPSSIALLHILSQHLQGQAQKTGRTGFKLCILHVKGDRSADPEANYLFEDIKHRYPDHEYLMVDLAEALSIQGVSKLIPDIRVDDESIGSHEEPTASGKLNRLLDSFKSATSRRDAVQILKRRLIVDIAKQHDCEAVLCGHSTTTLAQKTLAETAKGRGFALPWVVADGESPHGIPFYYPLREVMHSEVTSYVSFIEPPFALPTEKHRRKLIVNAKSTTIDDLTEQYFKTVEQEYPSTVANVVRTTGKLKPTASNEIEQQCELCEMPFEGQAPERSRLCYGCIRTMSQ